ncbi:N-formylglutamate amidohydrolase [Trinickia symbiotica]|uniref:N-formylglutamate amidohydrolase n=1 Tax=Trinickia symbiotica TaxID=863227 RepID=UPI002FCE48F9
MVECGNSPLLVLTPHADRQIQQDLIRLRSGEAMRGGGLVDPAGEAVRGVARTLDAPLIGGLYHPCVIDLNVEADDLDPTPHFQSAAGLPVRHS